jgi:hypothetical protein
MVSFILCVLFVLHLLLFFQEHLGEEVLRVLALFFVFLKLFNIFFTIFLLLCVFIFLIFLVFLLILVHIIYVQELPLEFGKRNLLSRLFLDVPDIAVFRNNLVFCFLTGLVSKEACSIVAEVLLKVDQNVARKQLVC